MTKKKKKRIRRALNLTKSAESTRAAFAKAKVGDHVRVSGPLYGVIEFLNPDCTALITIGCTTCAPDSDDYGRTLWRVEDDASKSAAAIPTKKSMDTGRDCRVGRSPRRSRDKDRTNARGRKKPTKR